MLASSPDPQKRGGVSGHVLNLTDWLRKVDHIEVTLVSFGENNSFDESGSFRRIELKKKGWYRLFPIIPVLRLARTVSREKPDILHVQGSSLGYMLLYAIFVAPKHLPKVLTVHGHPMEEGLVCGWLKRGSLRHKLMVWVDRMIPGSFDAIVAVTSKLGEDVKRKCNEDLDAEVSVIPNGVDASLFKDGAVPEVASRFDQDLCTAGLTLMNAKALTVFNGQDVLVHAFVRISDCVKGARLLLAGDGPERDRLMESAARLGVADGVQFLGILPNSLMPELMSASDIVVIPSKRIGGVEEGSSLLLLEAMACGKPVVASDLGGNAEAITDGETGILVPENNPDAIADAVLRLHDNPILAATIGRRARDYVLRERTWEVVARRYASVYSFVVHDGLHSV